MKLYEALEEEAIRSPTIIGMRVNRIYDHPHLTAPLNLLLV
jgi:hypothetical protein